MANSNHHSSPPQIPPATTYKKRYHRDANYESAPVTLNLFSVYQICDLACASDHTVRQHHQICHEISYIVSGEGVFIRNGQSYPVSPGCVFLVNDQDVHSIRSSKDSPIRFMCLGFAFHKEHPDYAKYAHIDAFFNALQNPLATDKYNLFNLFILALDEVSASDSLASEMLESYVRQIVIQTYRTFSTEPRHKQSSVEINDTNPLIYEIAHYIDSHLPSIKKLSDIAEVFDYSYAYMSRIFSQTMGLSIRDYYSQRRLEMAAEMLVEGLGISTISEKLQFADVPSFCKAFKAHYNVTPKNYQKMKSAQEQRSSSTEAE